MQRYVPVRLALWVCLVALCLGGCKRTYPEDEPFDFDFYPDGDSEQVVEPDGDGLIPGDGDGPDIGPVDQRPQTRDAAVEPFGPGEWNPPTPHLTPDGEMTIAPFETLNFHADASLPAEGDITDYYWHLVQSPALTLSTLDLSPNGVAAALTPDFAGQYTLRLNVRDEGGVGFAPARADIWVRPQTALYVELGWTTPGDDDEADDCTGCGADLDLHMVPLGGLWGGPLDCTWLSPQVDWSGEHDPQQACVLAREDFTGRGPEIAQVEDPSNLPAIAIGAQVLDDAGFGPSTARLVIWLDGEAVFTGESDPLDIGQFWTAATLRSDGTVLPVNRVSDGYPNN